VQRFRGCVIACFTPAKHKHFSHGTTSMLLSDLRVIPNVILDVPFSGDAHKRVEQALAEKKITTAEIGALFEDYKSNGRKHFFLLGLPESDWGCRAPKVHRLKFHRLTRLPNSSIFLLFLCIKTHPWCANTSFSSFERLQKSS
jgi:hypothetical protein